MGVVAAAGLAFVAGGAAHAGEADEAELPRVHVHLGHQLEQAFVNAAQLFGAHVAVVDGRQCATSRGGPAQALHRAQQRGVGERCAVQVGALAGGEQATQRGQPQTWLALAKAAEDDAHRLPQVVEAGVGAAEQRQVAQPGHGIAVGIQLRSGAAGLGRGVIVARLRCRGHQAALFDSEQEDEAVHQPQQLGEVVLALELTRLQLLAQRLVGRVLHEALAQRDERIRHAAAQALAHAGAFFLPGLLPAGPHHRRGGSGGLVGGHVQQAGPAGVQ